MSTTLTQERPKNVFEGQFINAKQASEYLGVSYQNLRVFCRKNKIPFYRPFKTRLTFKLSDLDAYISSTKQTPTNTNGQYAVLTKKYLGAEYLPAKVVNQMFAISPSQLRSMCRNREIPHYQPTRNKLFFKKSELLEWIEGTRVAPYYEAQAEANAYIDKTKLKSQ